MTEIRRGINWASPLTGAVVTGGVLFSVALCLAWVGLSMRELENSLPAWHAAPGTLTRAALIFDYVPKRNTPKQWQPDVRYRYAVKGVEYEGHILLWGDESSNDRDKVETNMVRILGNPYDAPLPRPLTVYYSPGEPQLSVLEPKNHSSSSYGAFAVAIFFGWVGLIAVMSNLQRLKAGRTDHNSA